MDGLWDPPARQPGATELALGETLAAWKLDGILATDGDAVSRAVLTDMAVAVDLARALALRGVRGGAFNLSKAATVLSAELRRHGRLDVAGHDPIQSLIDEITSGAAVHDTAESG